MLLCMFLVFNTSPVVSCDSAMALDDISPYRDLKVTEICQHVITCHRPCKLMLARVKMDEKDKGSGGWVELTLYKKHRLMSVNVLL